MIVESDINEGEKIVIVTVEKDTSFSDSNISQKSIIPPASDSYLGCS